MRDTFEITKEVLTLSTVETLALYILITTKTDFIFSSEQWVKIVDIAEDIDDQAISPQISYLLEDIMLLPNNDDIRSIFLEVNLEKGLLYPITPPPPNVKDPVFVSKSCGIINNQVFHPRRTCPACTPHDKNSSIAEVNRSEVEGFMHLCPICKRKERILREQQLAHERAMRKISK